MEIQKKLQAYKKFKRKKIALQKLNTPLALFSLNNFHWFDISGGVILKEHLSFY